MEGCLTPKQRIIITPQKNRYDKLVPYFSENDLSWMLGVSSG